MSKTKHHQNLFHPVAVKGMDVTPSTGGFVWITGTGLITKTPDTRRAVRSHVMSGYRKEKKAADLQKKKISLETDKQITESSLYLFDSKGWHPWANTGFMGFQASSRGSSLPSARTEPSEWSCSFCGDSGAVNEGRYLKDCRCRRFLPMGNISDFCATQKDPFFRYPIEVTPQDVKLIEFILDDTNANKVVHRHETLSNAILDPVAFHQMLGNFAWWLCFKLKVSGAEKYLNRDAIRHHGKAMRAVNQRIRDGLGVTSDGMIAAVLGFVHHAHVRLEFFAWSNHMKGIKEMVRLRGGIQTLNPDLKNTLYWHDLGGASTQVTPLLFDWSMDPISSLLPLRPPASGPSPAMEQVTKAWLKRLPNQQEFFDLLEYLYRVVDHFKEEFNLNGGPVDVVFSLRYIVKPMLYRLLNFNTMKATKDETSTSLSTIIESCRLAALMFLAPIRRHFGIYPVVSTIQVAKLRKLLLQDNFVDWYGLEVLQFWVVTMGYIESTEDKAWWRDKRDKFGSQAFWETQLQDFLWIDFLHCI